MSRIEELRSLFGAAASTRADRHTMDTLGVPSLLLMERAALAVAQELRARFARQSRVIVLCGPGNNSGDGLAMARQLHGWGMPVRVHLCTERRNRSVEGQLRIAQSVGVELVEGVPTEAAGGDTIVVDALLGTGSRGAPRGAVEEALRWLGTAKGPKVAIDVPTGIDPDTGTILGEVAQVDLTVTMHRSKPGLHITPGRDVAGTIVIAKIGLVADPCDVLDARSTSFVEPSEFAELVDPWAVAAAIRARAQPAHKGERGHVGVIGGSPGATGAAVLAATAALRCGAGLVTVSELDPGSGRSMIAGRPELMTAPTTGGTWDRPLPRADVLVVGPGLTRPADRLDLATLWHDDPRPAIWDASALDEIPPIGAGDPVHPRIITPHPGEARRLLQRLGDADERALDLRQDRRRAARALARRTGSIVVLKGAGTLIDDGARLAIAISGGPGLATAGSGDCLTGFIAAWVAAGHDLFAAACAGVHLHGVAGELAVADHPWAIALDIAALAGAAMVASPHHHRWPQLHLG